MPYRAGAFPLRAAAFQARDATGMLAGALESGEAAVLTSDSVVVSGLGGVGKTQVALDYAEGVWASGAVGLVVWVVWVTASSREAIVSAYARLATALTGIEGSHPEPGARRSWSGWRPPRSRG